MLCLSRKEKEVIRVTVPPSTVPHVIEVKVVEIRGIRVNIGIEADPSIKIDRAEVADRATEVPG